MLSRGGLGGEILRNSTGEHQKTKRGDHLKNIHKIKGKGEKKGGNDYGFAGHEEKKE